MILYATTLYMCVIHTVKWQLCAASEQAMYTTNRQTQKKLRNSEGMYVQIRRRAGQSYQFPYSHIGGQL